MAKSRDFFKGQATPKMGHDNFPLFKRQVGQRGRYRGTVESGALIRAKPLRLHCSNSFMMLPAALRPAC
jgi:hypothetical protein